MDLAILLLLLRIILIGSVLSQQQNTCPKVDFIVPEREIKHGSLKGFFAIAKGISDTIQPKIADDTVQKLGNQLTGEGAGVELEPEIKGLSGKQAKTIIFFGFGILIAICAFFSGLSILISRCCCQMKSHESNKSTTTARYVLPLLLIPAFIFVLAGFIINCQSSELLFKSAEGSRTFITDSKTEFLKFFRNGIDSVKCTFDDEVKNTIGEAKSVAQKAPDEMLDKLKEITGLSLLDKENVAKIPKKVEATIAECNSLEKSIDELLGSSTDTVCRTKLEILRTLNSQLIESLKNFKEIYDKYKNRLSESGDVRGEMKQKIDQYIADVETTVQGQWNDYKNEFDKFALISSAADDAEKKALDGIEWVISSEPYKTVKYGFSLLVTVPAIVTILIILLTFCLSFMHVQFPEVSSKIASGNVIRCCFKFVMVGFYVTILFGAATVTLSSFEYLFGTVFSAGCKTFFEDDSFSAFSFFKTEQDIPGGKLNISARDALTKCKEGKTLFTAINAESVFNSKMILEKIDLTKKKEDFSKIANELLPKITEFQGKVPETKDKLELLKEVPVSDEVAAQGRVSLTDLNVLSTCPVDKRKKVEQSMSHLERSIEFFKDETTDITAALDKIRSMPNIGDKVRTELDVYFNRFVEIIKQGINSVLNQLSTKLLPCRSVYVMYKNLGTYLCQDVGGPVHGIWASAGLCGIWFVITAAILFAIDRTLSADDSTSPPRKSPSSLPSQT